jgi:hypothetical protein
VPEKADLRARPRLVHRRRKGHQRIQAFKDPRAVGVHRVKGPGARQHFQRALADPFQIHPPGKVKEGGKGLLGAVFLAARGDN